MRIELQSNNFKVLLAEFTQWLQVRRKSASCISNYPLALKEYFLYLEATHNIKHINKVEKKHSTMFKQNLQVRTNKNTGYGGIHNHTINGILKALNSFNRYIAECSQTYKYAITEDYLPIDVAEKIVLTSREVKELYMATYEAYPFRHSSQAFGERDRIILHLLYSAGLRKNEARWLDISDLDFANSRILVRKGKGNKQRYAPCTNQVMDEIKAYIQNGRYYFTECHHNKTCKIRVIKKKQTPADMQALILSIDGKRLMSFDTRLVYLKSKTSITKAVQCHILRHSYGTHLYQKGMKIEKIQQIFGHASQDTTQIYIHIANRMNDEEQGYNEAV